jgi:hypothetical protein
MKHTSSWDRGTDTKENMHGMHIYVCVAQKAQGGKRRKAAAGKKSVGREGGYGVKRRKEAGVWLTG